MTIYHENKVMPVRDHCNLISKQFLISIARPNHLNHADLSQVPERLMRNTLQTKFSDEVKPLDGRKSMTLITKPASPLSTPMMLQRLSPTRPQMGFLTSQP